jgi:tetratricopeptide (TPR) repeat protein
MPMSFFTSCFSIHRYKVQLLVLFSLLAFQGHSQPGLNFAQVGINHLRKAEYIQALESFNLAIKKDPAYAELYFFRGYTKFNLDDYLGAELDYSRSIDLSPYQAEVFLNRAIVRGEMENYHGAFEDYARAQSSKAPW